MTCTKFTMQDQKNPPPKKTLKSLDFAHRCTLTSITIQILKTKTQNPVQTEVSEFPYFQLITIGVKTILYNINCCERNR